MADATAAQMVKYEIVKRPPRSNYRLMRATANIGRGEEILAEAPRVRLPTGLLDTHDASRFFDPASVHNAVEHLKKMKAGLPAAQQAQLQALHNNNRAHGLTGLIATNAFGNDEDEDGQTWMVLYIFNLISRINHSCVPNAAMEYDPARKMSVLHALTPIATGNEIFVNYLIQEEHSLSPLAERRQELGSHYHFTCNCQDCSLTGQQLATNEAYRASALAEFLILNQDYPAGLRAWRTRNLARQNRLPHATQYLNDLQQLNIIDCRLGWAYRKLADTHEELYDMTREPDALPGPHYPQCQLNGGPVWHLDDARDACQRALTIDTRVYGQDHAETKRTLAQIMGIAANRAREP